MSDRYVTCSMEKDNYRKVVCIVYTIVDDITYDEICHMQYGKFNYRKVVCIVCTIVDDVMSGEMLHVVWRRLIIERYCVLYIL